MAVVHWRDPWHGRAGGAERYAWESALGLRDGGDDVVFVTARDAGQAADEIIDGIRVRRRGGQFSWYVHVWLHFLLLRMTGRSYDATLESECGIPVFVPLVAPRRTAVVLVMHHVHLDQFRTAFPWPVSAVGRFLEGRLMPRVYRDVPTIAVSESTRSEMASRLGWTRPVTIVPNGADPGASTGPGEESAGRVLVLGRLVPHKRVDLVVRAVAALGPGVRLDVVGGGSEEQRLRDLVVELGVGDRVTVHGYVDEARKRDLLGRSRLHVCASDAEGWGLVVVEAAASGIPTVARDVPGLRDSIGPGRTGWLVDTGGLDAERTTAVLGDEIARALSLLDDEEVRAEVASACRSWAGTFTWERTRSAIRDVVHAATS